MTPQQTVGTSPIAYPTIALGGITYTLKLNLRAQYYLEQLGLPVQAVKAALDAGQVVSVGLKMLSACAGRDTENGWEPIGKSPEQLADMLAMSDLPAIAGAISGALLKAFPAPTNAPSATIPEPLAQMTQ